MTNIIQYLDICADNLKRLRDMGITPTQIVIEVSQPILTQAIQVIHGQGEWVTARYVQHPFKGEVLNQGLVRFSRNGMTFYLSLKVEGLNNEIKWRELDGKEYDGSKFMETLDKT